MTPKVSRAPSQRGTGWHVTLAFSCGARSAFKLEEYDYLRSMLSRRQRQGFVGCAAEFEMICWQFNRPPLLQNTTSYLCEIQSSIHYLS